MIFAFLAKFFVMAAVLLVLTRLPKIKKAHPLYFILGSACVGIAFGYLGWI